MRVGQYRKFSFPEKCKGSENDLSGQEGFFSLSALATCWELSRILFFEVVSKVTCVSADLDGLPGKDIRCRLIKCRRSSNSSKALEFLYLVDQIFVVQFQQPISFNLPKAVLIWSI